MRQATHEAPSRLGWHTIRTWCMALGLALTVAGCASSPSLINTHDTYFAQFGVRVDGTYARSTNYRGGSGSVLVPINTEVTFVSRRRSRYTMQLEGGRTFVFEHVKRHTKDSPENAFANVFATTPVDLSVFFPEEQESIMEGEPVVGMSRDAVLAAMGPPPAVGTLMLSGDTWKYWRDKWRTFYVRFDAEGRVSSIGK